MQKKTFSKVWRAIGANIIAESASAALSSAVACGSTSAGPSTRTVTHPARTSRSIGNADRVMGALVLGEGVAERAIDIWAVWSGVVEPIHLFSGVGDEAQVAERVDIALVGEHQRTAFLPRRFINAASGFRTLLPAGTVVRIGQQTIRLERQ